MSDTSRSVSLDDLELEFARELEVDKRAAAETAYALACRYRNEDVHGLRRFDLAKIWALRTVELLDSLPSDRLDSVASTRQSVAGISMPDLLHANLVRKRLADVLI